MNNVPKNMKKKKIMDSTLDKDEKYYSPAKLAKYIFMHPKSALSLVNNFAIIISVRQIWHVITIKHLCASFCFMLVLFLSFVLS